MATSNPLDSILKKHLIGDRDLTQTYFESINASGNSLVHDISGSEQGGLVSVQYESGVSLSVTFAVQGSIDGVSFADIADTPTLITDASGSVTWDFVDLNANFIRIKWTVTSGSVDIFGQSAHKRRH